MDVLSPQRTGNVVDFGEYRARRAVAEAGASDRLRAKRQPPPLTSRALLHRQRMLRHLIDSTRHEGGALATPRG